MPDNYRIQRKLFSSGLKHLTPQQTNKMILGGLAAAQGRLTHPIYSAVQETLGYIIALR